MVLSDNKDGKLGWKKWFIASWAVMECLLFSGLLFAWGSLSFVLKDEGIYADLCENADDDVQTITNASVTSRINLTKQNSIENHTGYQEPCKAQDEKMALCFTIAVTAKGVWLVVVGFINYMFGSRISRLISFAVFKLGAVMMILVSKENPWMMFPGLTLISMGGFPVMATNMQVANLFIVGRASVVCFLTSAIDCSSVVLLLMKILHDHGFERRKFFMVLAGLHLSVLISSVFFLPKLSIKKIAVTDDQNEATEQDITNVKNSLHMTSFKQCLVHKAFITNLIWFVVLYLRHQCFIGPVNQYLTRVLQDENQVSYFTNVCYYTMLIGGFIGAFVTGPVYDWQRNRYEDAKSPLFKKLMPSVLPLTVTSFMASLLSVLVLLPATNALYPAFIVFTIFRSFLFGSINSFLNNVFPSQYVVFLYGTMHLLSAMFNLLQYPIYTWSANYGSLQADIFILCMSIVTFANPLFWWVKCWWKKKEIVNENYPVATYL